MIIKAERMRIEEDTDNNLWIIDFRDEKKDLRGKIEIPSKIVSMEEAKELEIEIYPRGQLKEPIDNSNSQIVFNAKTFRTKPENEEKIYSFSAGGLMIRIFSGKAIPEFKGALKEYIIIVR
jgi:hypothetical protein